MNTQKTYSLALLCLFQISIHASTELFAQVDDSDQTPFVIYGEVRGTMLASDSVSILIWDRMINNGLTQVTRKESLALEPGNLFDGSLGKRKFQFTVPLTEAVTYFSLMVDKRSVLTEFFAQPGDTVRIVADLQELNVFFTGKSKDKFKAQHQLRYLINEVKQDSDPLMIGANKDDFLKKEEFRELYEVAETAKNASNRLIRFVDKGAEIEAQVRSKVNAGFTEIKMVDFIRNHPNLDPTEKEFLELEALGMFWFHELARLKTQYDPIYKDLITEISKEFFSLNYTDSLQAQSFHYINLLHLITVLNEVETQQPFFELIQNLPPQTREIIALKTLYTYRKTAKYKEDDYKMALSFLKDDWMIKRVNLLHQGLSLNSEIAPYPLLDLEGKEVSFRDFKGSVLVLDFWFTGCKACVEFYSETISKLKSHYKDNPQVKVISVNVDTSVEKWKKSIPNGLYTNMEAINLHATGPKHPFLKHYELNGFPYFMVLDRNSQINFKGFTDGDLQSYIDIINTNLK